MSLEDRLYPLLSIYERLPAGFKLAAGATYRHLPARWRLGARYAEFRRLTEDCPAWSADQIRDYQFKQLRQVLVQAGNYCPFYQQRFAAAKFRPEELRSLDDL